MKIGIDATPLSIPFPCGTKNYAQELLKNLAKIDNKNQYFIFSSKKVSIPSKNNFKFIKIPTYFPVLKRQFFHTILAKKERLDVFHNLEPYGSVFLKYPRIITTVHDLDLSQTYPFFSKYLPNRILCEITRSGVFRNTNSFICVSRVIKKELKIHLEGYKKNARINTVYNGVSSDFKILERGSNKNKFFLAMGDFAPRKNIASVIKAYSMLPKNIQIKYKLYIVASTPSAEELFRQMSHTYSVGGYVKIFLNISLKKLVLLYNNAQAFIYPSFYEGFGLPIIEAFTCACPVITSDYGAMKEVAGKAAILVNPKSVRKISTSMIRIIEDNKLRHMLIKRGLKRAQVFSWEKTAVNTLKIYEKLYKTG